MKKFILIGQTLTSDRRITNEDKIKKLLTKKNFKILKLSKLSFIEQLRI